MALRKKKVGLIVNRSTSYRNSGLLKCRGDSRTSEKPLLSAIANSLFLKSITFGGSSPSHGLFLVFELGGT
jgi:hypothetical protein